MIRLFLATLVVLCAALPASGDVLDIAYGFSDGASGGIAVAQVDTTRGKIVSQEKKYAANDCKSPKKLRFWDQGRGFVLTNEEKDGPHLHVYHSQRQGIKKVTLPGIPDEVRAAGALALASCDEDVLVVVNLAAGEVIKEVDAAELLTPPGNAPQDMHVIPDGSQVVVSFQKDSKKAKRLGSRLAIFSLPDMELVHDLQLPRDHPELHIAGNNQQQGPGPEVVLVARTSDRLLATLDLYGGVMIADWSGAQQGKLVNMKYIPTSTDGSWGTAFPDRIAEMYFAGSPFVLVCNAGEKGGAVVVSLDRREIVWKRDVPPGLEHPLYEPGLHKAYSVCSGKTKRRTPDDVAKSYTPRPGVFVFDFTSREAVNSQPVKTVPTDFPLHSLVRVPGDRPLLLVSGGAKEPDTLLLFDAASESFLDQQPAIGSVRQFATE
ncbi:MAG: hypothetical protein KDA60_05130 [Planctomycetales bacterium]|nr:hypothetical protein [Planctomycetales bacterium]